MSTCSIELSGGRTSFLPGDTIAGTATWDLDRAPGNCELRLFWYTSGKGTQDVEVVRTLAFENPGASESRKFSMELPMEPYSFSGRLVTLRWALELVPDRGEPARVDIVMSATGEEIAIRGNTGKQE